MIGGEYTIAEQKPSVDEFLSLRKAVRWGNPNPETAASALDGSWLCVCVRRGDDLVGFGRVVADGGFIFYIQDMIVHPDYQRKGLGKAIMNSLMSAIEATAGQNAYVGLMAAGGAAGFYQRFGFSARPSGAPGMERLPAWR